MYVPLRISSTEIRLRWSGVLRSVGRSYWIPGSYAPALSEKQNAFLRLLKNKGFKEENVTKFGGGRHRHVHDPGIQQEPI